MNLLLTPLRPLADLIDLAVEAAAAVGALSVGVLGLVLTETGEAFYPPVRAVESPRLR